MQDDIKPPADKDDQPPTVNEPPANQQPLATDQPAAAPVPPQPADPVGQSPSPTQQPPAGPKAKPKPPADYHLVPIILAILVLVFLAGVAIITEKNKSKPTVNSPVPASTQNPPAASTDTSDQTVNDSIKSIDSLSNEEDTSGDSLSDQNLGL